ncbi:MAG: glycosyltransferase family 9 protein [Flavobacteriales bacterium]
MNKILVIQTAFIGDAILASALLETLHLNFPKAEIHMLLRKGNDSLYKDHPFLSHLWVWDKSKKYGSMMSVIKGIKAEQFDWCINLQRFASSGIMTLRSGAKVKSGYAKNPFSRFYTERFRHEIGAKGDQNFKHEVDRNNSIVASRTSLLVRQPKLYPSAQDIQKVEPYTSEPFITISPASVWFTKQWPKEKWVELLDLNSHLKVYALGGPGDKTLTEEILSLSSHKNAESLAGKLSLLQSVALMKKSEMNYVNDSAPMHLASSMNAPVTAIFCSTIPEFGFGPLSDDSTVWQSAEELDCRPCGLHGFKACPKGHFKCAQIVPLQRK